MPQQLKPISSEIIKQIKLYSKKGIDIAPLINGYDISNMDLSNCYISELNLAECSISNVNFNGTKMKFIFNKGVARNCTFICSNLLPGSSLRAADMRTCNLNGTYMPNLDFAYCDFRDVDICSTTFTFFSKLAYKAKFSKKFLEIMLRFIDIEGFKI